MQAVDQTPHSQRRSCSRGEPRAELPVYDEDQARRLVATVSHHSEHVVGMVLEAQAIYLAALGILPEDCVPEGVDLAAEVAEYSDLFSEELRAARSFCWELEAEFVSQRTELPYRHVLEVLLGVSGYELAIGIIASATYLEHERWVVRQLRPARRVDRDAYAS